MRDRRRFSASVEVDAWHRWLAAVRRLRAMLRDLRPRRVGEPRRRSEREHAALSLGRAAVELAEPYAHVAADDDEAVEGVDEDAPVPARVAGRRQQANPR